MKLMKKIASLGAAAMMMASVGAISASAFDRYISITTSYNNIYKSNSIASMNMTYNFVNPYSEVSTNMSCSSANNFQYSCTYTYDGTTNTITNSNTSGYWDPVLSLKYIIKTSGNKYLWDATVTDKPYLNGSYLGGSITSSMGFYG